jgi:predicted nucleic acid-binding Zn ribbon protein
VSKYQKYAEGDDWVYPHKHCPGCSAMIDEDQEYCGDQCALVEMGKEKKKKKTLYILIGSYAVVIVVFVVILVVSMTRG